MKYLSLRLWRPPLLETSLYLKNNFSIHINTPLNLNKEIKSLWSLIKEDACSYLCLKWSDHCSVTQTVVTNRRVQRWVLNKCGLCVLRWSGFLLCAVAMLLVIFPMFTFPKKLPPRHKKKKRRKKLTLDDLSSDDDVLKEKSNNKTQTVTSSMGFGKDIKGTPVIYSTGDKAAALKMSHYGSDLVKNKLSSVEGGCFLKIC